MDGSFETGLVPNPALTNYNTQQEIANSMSNPIALTMYSQPQISNTRHSIAPSDSTSVSGVPGVAFNTTPIYDAQGSLVGLQGPLDSNQLREEEAGAVGQRRNENPGYMTLPSVYPYNVPVQSTDQMGVVNYNPYVGYSAIGQGLANYQRSQPYMTYNPQLANYEVQQKSLLLPASNETNKTAESAYVLGGLPRPAEAFDTCPTMCSLFAILCCPITLWCSLPALLYSLCSYTDYRAADTKRYMRKSDLARNLVITACVIGLLLCLAWAILAFFYYEVILATINDFLRILHTRVSSSSSSGT